MKIGNHNYFLSWREPWHKFEVKIQLSKKISRKIFEKCLKQVGCGLALKNDPKSASSRSCRTGTGSTDGISAGIGAWTWCPLTHPESSRCLRRSWQEVRQRLIFINFGCIMDRALSGMRCEVVFKVGLDSCSR